MAEMQQVARLAEIAENRPFGVMLGDDSFVLIRNGSEVRAFSGKCPHAGAPLAEGAICNGRLICPWHKGSFAIADGRLLENSPQPLFALAQRLLRRLAFRNIMKSIDRAGNFAALILQHANIDDHGDPRPVGPFDLHFHVARLWDATVEHFSHRALVVWQKRSVRTVHLVRAAEALVGVAGGIAGVISERAS